jgi:hypothetical protein
MMKSMFLALPFLAACSSLVPTTIAQLSAIQPATMDPAALEVAVLMPIGLQPQPETAVLSVSGTRMDTGEVAKLDVVLAERAATLVGVDLLPGDTVFAYRVAEADLAALRAIQDTVNGWKSTVPGATQGTLSVGLGACTVGDGPAPDASGAVYIRMAEGAPMLPLIRRAPISGLIGAEAMASIRPCATAQ